MLEKMNDNVQKISFFLTQNELKNQTEIASFLSLDKSWISRIFKKNNESLSLWFNSLNKEQVKEIALLISKEPIEKQFDIIRNNFKLDTNFEESNNEVENNPINQIDKMDINNTFTQMDSNKERQRKYMTNKAVLRVERANYKKFNEFCKNKKLNPNQIMNTLIEAFLEDKDFFINLIEYKQLKEKKNLGLI